MRMRTVFMAAILGCVSSVALASDIIVKDAWIRAMPPSSKVVPIYLTLHNQSPTANALVAMSSPRGHVEIHQTVMKDNLMRMLEVDKIHVAAGGTIKLEPAGYHGMLMQLTQGVPKKGESVPVTLTMENGNKIELNVIVKSDNSHSQHDHSHH